MAGQYIRKPKARERCPSILRAITDAVFVCDAKGRIALANPAFSALVGKPEAEIVGCPAAGLEPSELARLALQQNDAVLADGETRCFEFVTPSPAGLRFFWVTKGLCRGRKAGVVGMARDITEQRVVEREIIDSSDHEKERLGHELRENFCQHLVGISLLGNVLFEELSRAGLEQARFARQITMLVKEVVSEIRTLEKGLSVAHLEQGAGLVEALRDLAEMVRAKNRVDCVLRAPQAKPAVAPETAMYLFRIAQEATHSALRRGPVRQLLIQIRARRGAVVLSVRDDGTVLPEGIAVDAWARGEFPIMHYRSRVIGAQLKFNRLKRRGVEVVCSVPRYARKRFRSSAKPRKKK